MPIFSKMETLNTMLGCGLVPLFYNSSLETAREIVTACAKGNIRAIEFTNRGSGAVDIFRELISFVKINHPEIIMGAGSIIDAATAALFIQHGANFIVSPCIDEETAIMCNKHKIPYSPGCGSVTEIKKAEALGVEICKIFPAGQVGGPDFIKSVLGPCPRSNLMPTGGVEPNEESLSAWFNAGAACVGLGSSLIPSNMSADSDFSSITSKLITAGKILSGLKRRKT